MIEMSLQDNRPAFDPNALSFIPLGGSGEFGCNMNVYHCNGKFLIVDCGIGFPEENHLGLEILMPDPSFLRHVQKDIVGMVITHAHDDHKGAIAALWPQLNCPIYATPFVVELMRPKLTEWNLDKRVPMHVVALGSTIDLDPFKVELINTAHSVVESNMLLINTPHGSVLHTGDWRLDDHPVEGESTDEKRLKELANENILAIIGDSTNATVLDRHPSEIELMEPLAQAFSEASGRVVLTTFAHSIPRMTNVANAAAKAGRRVGMMGRSMLRAQEAARKTGYMKTVPEFLREKQLTEVKPRQLVLLATGSQGEQGSAIHRLAVDDHPSLSLTSGDTVIFSAREIPGNEKNIERVRNSFIRRNIHVIMPETGFTHASGHAYADEMRDLFSWVKPVSLIPVHGSEENQMAQIDIAESIGIKHSFVPQNGDILAIRQNGVEKTGQVLSGLMAVDGVRVVPIKDSLLIKERNRIANEGSIVATIVVDDEGYLLHDPVFAISGLCADDEESEDINNILLLDVEQVILKAAQEGGTHPDMLRENIRLAIRRRIKQELGKRPLLNIHLVQLS